jgi:hypothetical protein
MDVSPGMPSTVALGRAVAQLPLDRIRRLRRAVGPAWIVMLADCSGSACSA